MIKDPLTKMLRQNFQSAINLHGGRYITPSENQQPTAELKIASIFLDGTTGIGATESQAQTDWINARGGAATHIKLAQFAQRLR